MAGQSKPLAIPIDTNGQQLFSATNVGYVNVQNKIQISPNFATFTVSGIEGTYDDVTTSREHDDIDLVNFSSLILLSHWTLCFTIQSAGTPTSLEIKIKVQDTTTTSGGTKYVLQPYLIMFEDTQTATAQNVAFPGQLTGARYMAIEAIATGTTASNTFTISNAKLLLSNG